MEWIEARPSLEKCKNCAKEDCYHCDTAGKRRMLSREDELRSIRMLMVRAIAQLQQKVVTIDAELEKLHRSE